MRVRVEACLAAMDWEARAGGSTALLLGAFLWSG
jgi:hypothetical protein